MTLPLEPPGLPEPFRAALVDLRAALAAPDVRERIASVGGEAFPGGPVEMSKFIAQQTARMGKVIRDGNIRPE